MGQSLSDSALPPRKTNNQQPMTNNLNPGVYVVLPGGETEHWVPESMNEAAKQLGYSLARLVEFFQAQWPSLSDEEASLLASAVIDGFPILLRDNPDMLQELSQITGDIKAIRYKT